MRSLGLIAATGFVGILLSGTTPALAGIHNGVNPEYNTLLVQVSTDQAQGARDFVAKLADQGIGLISKTDISDVEREKEFRKLLRENFDMKTIGRFALGRYWKSASKEEQAEYLKLFEDMIISVYSRRFKDYNGNALDVKSARADGENDAIVFSEIIPQSKQKIKVDWRVRNKNGKFSIVDIIVEGVSMSLTQRSDFASVIQRGGGDIEVLLAHLRKPVEAEAEEKTAAKK